VAKANLVPPQRSECDEKWEGSSLPERWQWCNKVTNDWGDTLHNFYWHEVVPYGKILESNTKYVHV